MFLASMPKLTMFLVILTSAVMSNFNKMAIMATKACHDISWIHQYHDWYGSNCWSVCNGCHGWLGWQKNVKTENVPISFEYMDQVEKKSLKECLVSINIDKYPARSLQFKIADLPLKGKTKLFQKRLEVKWILSL